MMVPTTNNNAAPRTASGVMYGVNDNNDKRKSLSRYISLSLNFAHFCNIANDRRYDSVAPIKPDQYKPVNNYSSVQPVLTDYDAPAPLPRDYDSVQPAADYEAKY